MIFWATIMLLFSINAQITGPTNSNNNATVEKTKNLGNIHYENYVDSDGTIKKRAFRYAAQYQIKPLKSSGTETSETYVDKNGDVNKRKFKYGFQYQGEEDATNKSKTMKAPPKGAASTGSESAGGPYGVPTPEKPAGSGSGGGSSSGSSPSSAASAASPANSEETTRKDMEIMNKMKDLIKQRQELKAGKSN